MADYPLPMFHFQVDWGGTKATFSEVTGLNVEHEVIEYSDGLSPEYSSVKMPGRKKNNNITLKRGVFKADNEFFAWWDTVKLNTIERRDITISLLDENHEPTMVWKVKNVWPVKIDAPDLKASDSQVAVESMELAHEGVVIENA